MNTFPFRLDVRDETEAEKQQANRPQRSTGRSDSPTTCCPSCCKGASLRFHFNLQDNAAGPQSKKRKSPAAVNEADKKQKGSTKTGPSLVQATVQDLSAAKASESGAELIDPNTGQKVHAPSGDSKTLESKPGSSNPESSKPESSNPAPSTKGKKQGQLVDPNTGEKVDASSTVESKPADPKLESKKVKEEEQSGTAASSSKPEPASEKDQPVNINRAPVLTLWVAVVSERQGFSREAGLTFGKAISGMLAQSKGRYKHSALLEEQSATQVAHNASSKYTCES